MRIFVSIHANLISTFKATQRSHNETKLTTVSICFMTQTHKHKTEQPSYKSQL